MKLKVLSDVIWEFYNEGRQKETAKTFDKRDILQYVLMGVGSKMRDRYYLGKKLEGETDYYFYTGDLDTKEYDLSEANPMGMRRVEIKDEVIKLPHNIDIVNVYPVGDCDDGDGTMEITQVSPGEENFYLSEEFSDFIFFVEKGRGLNAYHVPPCVRGLQVERLFVNDNMDISFDMAYDIGNEILGVTLKIKAFSVKPTDNPYSPKAIELRRKLEEQQQAV
jgi:hypothetical protein